MNDQAPLSEDLLVSLSAYVDGELNDEERAEVDKLVAQDPRVADELKALFDLNDDLHGAFDRMLDMPIPPALEASCTPEFQPAANINRAPPPWRSLAATLLLGAVLGAGSLWMFKANSPQPSQIASNRSWLKEVAEYHQVYARQTRHLVEVPASEKAHIEKWLGNEIGVAFNIPDLSTSGWTFQGARLLVAAGKPVAQLLYTDADGKVIALCALRNGSGKAADTTLRDFGDTHMAVWKTETGSFALIGDTPEQLDELAKIAAPLI